MHIHRCVTNSVEVTAIAWEPLKATMWVLVPGGEWQLLGEVKDLYMRAAGSEPIQVAWGPKPPEGTSGSGVLDVDREQYVLASPSAYRVLFREAPRPGVQETVRKLQKTPGEAQWKAERRPRGRR